MDSGQLLPPVVPGILTPPLRSLFCVPLLHSKWATNSFITGSLLLLSRSPLTSTALSPLLCILHPAQCIVTICNMHYFTIIHLLHLAVRDILLVLIVYLFMYIVWCCVRQIPLRVIKVHSYHITCWMEEYGSNACRPGVHGCYGDATSCAQWRMSCLLSNQWCSKTHTLQNVVWFLNLVCMYAAIRLKADQHVDRNWKT